MPGDLAREKCRGDFGQRLRALGVRRKPASADTPTLPRTDFALATSMRGSAQLVSPSGLVAFEAELDDLPAGHRLAIDQAQFAHPVWSVRLAQEIIAQARTR